MSEDATSVDHERAHALARMFAATRHRTAWDASGQRLIRLRRAPIISFQADNRCWISIDENEDRDAASSERWHSYTKVEEEAARRLLDSDGFPSDLAEVLLTGARLRAR